MAQAPHAGRTPTHLTDDWRARQSQGPLEFQLYWIPFVGDTQTPLASLTTAWTEAQKVMVGTVVFPRIDQTTRESRLTAFLVSEMGANQGNWQETDGVQPPLPATRFTAARFLAYRESQKGRGALPDDAYASFFDGGEIGHDLARELVRRYEEKRAAGHWVPADAEVTAGDA